MQRVTKRLVLCLDGTWNTDETDQVTNIVEIRNRIAPIAHQDGRDIPQLVYYDEGVGTGLTLDRIFGGGLGIGLGDNVRQAYRFLSGHYDDENGATEIYIFGFSRGAYTARALAGYLGAAGLLRPRHCNAENETRAWERYRTPPKDRYPADRLPADWLFPNVRIRVLGVFDTVGALGVPLHWFRRLNKRRYEFHDTELGSNVDIALHAIGLDEKRWAFQAAVWVKPLHDQNERVAQVWFPGVHANIGGGYRKDGLSRMTLHWMLSNVQATGLAFDFPEVGRDALHAMAADKLHDSRKSPLYLTDWIRPAFRKVLNTAGKALAGRAVGLPPKGRVLNEYVHWSCLHRMVHDKSYMPANLQLVLQRLYRTYAETKAENAAEPAFVVGFDGAVVAPGAAGRDIEAMLKGLVDSGADGGAC